MWRWTIAVGAALLAISIAASGSRGALVAAAATAAFAVVASPRRRAQVIILSAVVFAMAAVWLSTSPGLWQ